MDNMDNPQVPVSSPVTPEPSSKKNFAVIVLIALLVVVGLYFFINKKDGASETKYSREANLEVIDKQVGKLIGGFPAELILESAANLESEVAKVPGLDNVLFIARFNVAKTFTEVEKEYKKILEAYHYRIFRATKEYRTIDILINKEGHSATVSIFAINERNSKVTIMYGIIE